MSQAEWKLKSFDNQLSADLAFECSIPKPIANILVGRGIYDKEKAEEFMEKPARLIRSPKNLPDCANAVARLKKAIETKEKILVWGDFDVDGITSISIIVTCFRMFGANFVYRVPNRFHDGYDIRRHSVDECINEKATLMMSVDCGIVAFDTTEYAKTKGIDVIITDHHTAEGSGKLPNCVAVVNPSRLDSQYGFSGLCGAGVAFKLMLALGKALNFDLNRIIEENIEFVTLGTVADVAPMIDENRVLVHKGCQALSNSKKIGISEILRIAKAKEVDTTTIGFQIGPRMNAIGRLADPLMAVELMLETNKQRATFLASQLDAANKRRQSKQEHMVEEAFAMIEENRLYEMSAIVVWAKSWHIGLIGLVAGKIAEKYHRPAIVLGIEDENIYKGSCRSTRTLNILEVLKHPDVLPYYTLKADGSPSVGGHAFAAGMAISEENLMAFRDAVCSALSQLNPDFIPGNRVYFVDSRIVTGDINDKTFEVLQKLAPFGSGHNDPIFWVKNLLVTEQQHLKNDKHLKLIFQDDKFKFNKKISGLLWHRAAEYPDNYVGKKLDILFSFAKETMTFGNKFYLSIVDFKISS